MGKHDPNHKPHCLPFQRHSILKPLKAHPNWVLTKLVFKDGRWSKPPFGPNGYQASHSDAASWSSFDAVCAAYDRGGFDGIGYVLDGKPHFGGRYLHGFDWDDCIDVDPLTGRRRLLPEVRRAVRELEITRLEISLTGAGLRGFFLHDEPLAARKQRIDGRSVELYSSKRFLTTTGLCFAGHEHLS